MNTEKNVQPESTEPAKNLNGWQVVEGGRDAEPADWTAERTATGKAAVNAMDTKALLENRVQTDVITMPGQNRELYVATDGTVHHNKDDYLDYQRAINE